MAKLLQDSGCPGTLASASYYKNNDPIHTKMLELYRLKGVGKVGITSSFEEVIFDARNGFCLNIKKRENPDVGTYIRCGDFSIAYYISCHYDCTVKQSCLLNSLIPAWHLNDGRFDPEVLPGSYCTPKSDTTKATFYYWSAETAIDMYMSLGMWGECYIQKLEQGYYQVTVEIEECEQLREYVNTCEIIEG